MKTLKDVSIGQTVKVKKLTGEGPVKRRIMDMGITKGVEIYVRKVAPLLSGSALTSHRVPANDAYYSANISGMSVLVPDVPLIREQLLDYLPLG